jgi:beta-1,2-mannosidase
MLLGPWIRDDAANPCLTPRDDSVFRCPVRHAEVRWESKDVFNPAAVVRDGRVCLLYRAEDDVGAHAGTSRIGLAMSADGIHFERHPLPVLFPDHDLMFPYEWDGGCEDPRIVEDEAGRYVLTYTAFDGTTARLAVATSTDLVHWQKHGLAFGHDPDEGSRTMWSKSGAIITRREGHRLVATRIGGSYWMYWGDTDMFLARSDDLVRWEIVRDADGSPLVVFGPRPGRFDSDLVEPGPPPVWTERGIECLYNCRNSGTLGDVALPEGTYAPGWVLLDPDDPRTVLERANAPVMQPERPYEITGQIGNVCFLEGLLPWRDGWLVYYGTADSRIAVARAAPSPNSSE